MVAFPIGRVILWQMYERASGAKSKVVQFASMFIVVTLQNSLHRFAVAEVEWQARG
jgi:hypothetical protein